MHSAKTQKKESICRTPFLEEIELDKDLVMNPFLLIRGELKRSLAAALAVALVLALAVSRGVAVSISERSIRQGMTQAGDDFDLLIGAQGSPAQLVLGAVYLRPEALQLIPGTTFDNIQKQEGVLWAAPLAFGDRWHSSPIIGTTVDMVLLGGKRRLEEGRVFAASNEAVIGASVPLNPGDSFSPMHGRIETGASDHKHAHVSYTVTGRLPATGTPWDRSILIPMEGVWKTHGLASNSSCFSAIVVKPKTIADAYRLRASWTTSQTQGVFTGEVLTTLFAAMGEIRDIMQYMALSAEGVALCAALLAGFFAVALRRKMLALLRALGAPKRYIIVTVWLLVTLTISLGGAVGLMFGWGAARIIGILIRDNTGVVLPVTLSEHEGMLFLGILLTGSLVALLPALASYRTSAGDTLRG